jgi:hypothetical protein
VEWRSRPGDDRPVAVGARHHVTNVRRQPSGPGQATIPWGSMTYFFAAPCLVVIAVVFGLFGPAGWSLAGLGATAFLLGWCLARVDSFDLQLLVRRVLVLPGRLARAIWSVPRHIVRRRR